MKPLPTIIIAFAAGLAGAFVFNQYQERKEKQEAQQALNASNFESADIYQPNIIEPSRPSTLDEKIDFSGAANKTIPSVVFINSISQSGVSYSYWDLLFGGGGQQQQQVSSGSGVIFTADGFIVTNNHVVETAEKIEVLYNKKVYPAELIGTDPSTDLAVLKIKESNLPAITLGSSKNLSVGEWVVAVGNPFSLSSTVTVGIVSAKGRRINIVEDKFPIESFIQTDAAINPGNSGGALVNKNGELVGINTAILSRTGSYTGYAFAVPVDIAKKVVNDLIKHGIAQKAVFGGNVSEYDFNNAKKFNMKTDVAEFKGVLLEEVNKVGAAKDAGLKPGDVIKKINDVEVNTKSAFEEELAYRMPGDKITITYARNEEIGITTLTLVNKNGEPTILKRRIIGDASLGASLEAVDYGVKVSKIKEGWLQRLGIPENSTIISLNRKRVKEPQEVIDFFNSYHGRVLLYGVNSSKQEFSLQFMLQ